jgi:hypothetical protein
MRRLLLLACLTVALLGCKKEAKEPEPKAKAMNPFDRSEKTGNGVISDVARAPKRTVAQNDMHNLHLLIETISGASGNMPDANTILTSLKQDPDARKIAEYIEEGWIILTGIKQREGVWAYEKEALTTRGFVVTNSGVEMLSKEELQAKLR